ncbi:uncharacterized protein [Triticum aestivum]|uniref:uncharacterized protein isoform X1 n=1 Tax=Triticum aestivum TaxID=4565 RepID=UPI001D02BB4C|nr:uncharacterized protein LOC123128613 isoform X1 [Triticum aestivum]XP_044404598.1 uncharacterized protein LOC123128613 isoform X2 [Triticum aestivum]
MRRESLKKSLLSFPEAAALDELQLDDAADRIFREYDPSTATPTPEGMVRLDDETIIDAFKFANWFLTSTAEDEPPAGADPLVWLDERRRTLDEETKRCGPNNSRLVIAKIRVDLLTKGYVELPRSYVECIPQDR